MYFTIIIYNDIFPNITSYLVLIRKCYLFVIIYISPEFSKKLIIGFLGLKTKHFLKIAVVCLSFHFLFSVSFPSFILADTIIIAADSWCPINCEPGSKKPGFMIEIAQSVFADAGHEIIYEKIPWARTLLMVRNGVINGAVGPYINDAPDFIFPDEELAMVGLNMFVTKDNNWTYKGVSSLNDITLGVVKGYSYLEELDDYIKKNRNRKIFFAHGNDPLKKNIQLLLKGRIDAVIATDIVFWHVATQIGVQNKLKSAGIAGKPNKSYIAFSPTLPKSKQYATTLSNGITKLRKTGEMARILKKYGLTDWKNSQNQ